MNDAPPDKVVIIGGGFGGLSAARELHGSAVQVTLVDRSNHHLFQPLLYQVATAGLSPADIAYPIRTVLRHQANARVLLAEVTRIDLPGKHCVLDDGSHLPFDWLVIAAGARTNYFDKEKDDRIQGAFVGAAVLLEPALQENRQRRLPARGRPEQQQQAPSDVGAGRGGLEILYNAPEGLIDPEKLPAKQRLGFLRIAWLGTCMPAPAQHVPDVLMARAREGRRALREDVLQELGERTFPALCAVQTAERAQ